MNDGDTPTDLVAEACEWSDRAHQTFQATGAESARTSTYGGHDERAADDGETAWKLLDDLLAALPQERSCRADEPY